MTSNAPLLILASLVSRFGSKMPVNLSIKNAPDDMVARLRARAKQNHRSLQGELMAILEQASAPLDHRQGKLGISPSQSEERATILAEIAAFRATLPMPHEDAVTSVRRNRDR